MKKLFLLIFFLPIAIANVFATHNEAGEITYKYIGNATFPYKYHITVTTYTNTNPSTTSADRCELMVVFGDGDSAIAPRTNGIISACPFARDGEQVNTLYGISTYPQTSKNIYEVDHNYSGPSAYTITVTDLNRNAGTCNIAGGGSVNIAFSLQTEIIINNILGPDNSPVLYNLPLDFACIGQCWEHNPGAFDIDGDSLYFELDTCYQTPFSLVPNFVWPPNMSINDIDHFKGDVRWCVPTIICQYNIGIRIKSYRRIPWMAKRYYIGSVLRDMQIVVKSCSDSPPDIPPMRDTCIVAGTNLSFPVSATDAQSGTITLSAEGGPFHIIPSASFSSSPSSSPVTGTFSWTPNCNEVELLPYLVTFKATDAGALVDYESMFIRVVAPAPTWGTATPSGASIVLNWNDAPCSSTTGDNPLFGYYVYRKNSCDPWVHDACQTGLPPSSGYTLIGTTGTTSTFVDNNSGAGLISGINYSYIVVAFYSDGSQSYASTNICAILERDVPIITNVSVLTTDALTGTIWTHWIKPLTTAGNLDTLVDTPPYKYVIRKATGSGMGLTYVAMDSIQYPASFASITDTGYISSNLNTELNSYSYRIDFYSNNNFIGSTNTASSVHLGTVPAGNQITLNWNAVTPWINYKYYIYRKYSPATTFSFIGTSNAPTYTDTALANGVEYCYFVQTEGEYTDTTIVDSLLNNSQIHCDRPVDIVPPCQPTFMVETDCGIFQNVISWTNPNGICCDDAVGYNVYFAPTTEEPLQIIYSTNDLNVTSYTHIYLYQGVPSVAGCYAVTAVDTFANESVIINKLCVDNCPEYELPNVFTPNADGTNDLVTPLPGYRYVLNVDMKIYDRWGLIMFETKDKDILWDGKNKDSKGVCPDGVYFYVCTVNEIHVEGIRPRTLKGFIQLLHEPTNSPK